MHAKTVCLSKCISCRQCVYHLSPASAILIFFCLDLYLQLLPDHIISSCIEALLLSLAHTQTEACLYSTLDWLDYACKD